MPTHDQAHRRKAQPGSGRQRGVWVYITADELTAYGFSRETPPYYRIWPDPKRPRLTVNLYPEP